MTQANKSLAFGVIRRGAIPNPSIGRQVARMNNPKEILGIIVNPDESKPAKTKRGNAMKKKKKTAARPKKKRSAPSRAAARPKAKTRKVATRAGSRVRRRNPDLAAGYEAPSREVNARRPKRKKASKKRSSKRGAMSTAQVRNLLRSVASRIKNSSAAPRGRTTQRGGLSSSSFGATEIRRAGLLDGAFEIQTLDDEIQNLQAELVAATGDDMVKGLYARELAQKVAERERLLGGLGFLDAAIIGGKSKELSDLRLGLLGAATERKKQAASRAIAASKFKGLDKRRNDFFAALAIAIVTSDTTLNIGYFPALSKKFQIFDPYTLAPGGRDKDFSDIKAYIAAASRQYYYNRDEGKQVLLALPKESIHEAIRMLHRNFLPTAIDTGSAKERSDLAVALDRLHGILEGRIENPRGRKRRSKKRKATRGRKKRRVSNPSPRRGRKKRKSSKKKYSRKRRGARRRNPRGSEIIARLVSGQASLGDVLKVSAAAMGGYIAVTAGEWLLRAVGAETAIKNLAGNSAQWGSALSSAVSGLVTGGAIWGLGTQVKGVNDVEIPVYIGVASRVVVNLIDAFARQNTEATKLIRSAAGLAPTVSGHGRWNPNMDGYYNFQPVMGNFASRGGYSVGNYANRAGYSVGNFANRGGYSVGNGANRAGYSVPSVKGYYNMAPSMGGYSNFVPKLNNNPMGQPF